MAGRLAPQFIPTPRGQAFLLHRDGGERRCCVVVAQGFEEELNRCRYMVNLLGQAVAAQGIGLMVLDPWGTGDSAGEFEAVDWSTIRADVEHCVSHATAAGYERVVMLGIRLGALVALEVAARSAVVSALALWQPVLRGQQIVTSLFRAKIAAAMGRNEESATVKEYLARSAGGETIEIGGYRFSPAMIAGLNEAELDAAIAPVARPVLWVSAVASEERPAPRAEAAAVEKWRGAGKQIDYQVVVGPPYWQSAGDRMLAPAVVGATAPWILGQGA